MLGKKKFSFEYDEEFDGHLPHEIVNKRVEKDYDIEKYNRRFSLDEIKTYFHNTPFEIANKYDERFAPFEIKSFYEKRDLPEMVNQYGSRFYAYIISNFIHRGYSPELINNFDTKESGSYILSLLENGFTPETAPKYNGRFDDEGRKEMMREGVCPELADKYDERFCGTNIARMVILDCPPEIANSYNKRFSGWDVDALHFVKCLPKIADMYPGWLDGDLISVAYALDITPTEISEKGIDFLEKINEYRNQFASCPSLKKIYNREFLLLGYGKQGIVFFDKGSKSAWKFSKDIAKEVANSRDLEGLISHSSPLRKHLIFPFGEIMDDLAVKMKYIDGITLREAIFEKGVEKKDAVEYSRQLLHEIINEFDKIGFYHRDLHPENLMIENGTNLLKVIDYGKSSVSTCTAYGWNKFSGGRDDLYSWALITYSLFTGEHLCGAKYKGENYEEFKERISRLKEDLYVKDRLNVKYMIKIRKRIPEMFYESLILALQQKDIQKVVSDFRIQDF